MPFVVGLTGGIGSGKSSATIAFQQCGAGVVDADVISHQLTAPGGLGLAEIIKNLGADYLYDNGELNRAKLRQKIFTDVATKKQLEQILHPLIRAEISLQLAASTAPYVILVVPLLLEAHSYRALVERILVIDCSEAEQITRTIKRSNLRAEEVRAIMATQLSRAERIKYADDILDNNNGLDALERQVKNLHQRYLDLAQQGK